MEKERSLGELMKARAATPQAPRRSGREKLQILKQAAAKETKGSHFCSKILWVKEATKNAGKRATQENHRRQMNLFATAVHRH